VRFRPRRHRVIAHCITTPPDPHVQPYSPTASSRSSFNLLMTSNSRRLRVVNGTGLRIVVCGGPVWLAAYLLRD